MFEEIAEMLFGPVGIALVLGAILLKSGNGKSAGRSAVKKVVRGGLIVTEKARELTAQAQESLSDLVAEARDEMKQDGHEPQTKKSGNKRVTSE